MYLRVPLNLFCSTYGYFCTSKISIVLTGTSVSVNKYKFYNISISPIVPTGTSVVKQLYDKTLNKE